MIKTPRWWFWLQIRLQNVWFRGWCGFIGHDFRHHTQGAPVVGPLWICRRCGKFERA